MTIAAGFPCRDGLILCADTQEVISGYVKTETEKTTVIRGDKWNVVITGAGDADFIELAVQEIHHDLNSINGKQTLQKVIKETLKSVFVDTVQPYASFPVEDRPSATLLIGVQSEGVVGLYKSNGLVFRRMDTPECVGMGIALGKSLTAQFFRKEQSLKEAGLTAIYILHQVKKWVDGCGGNSDIILLSQEKLAWARIPTDEVKILETNFDMFTEAIRPILVGAVDSTLPHPEFDQLLKDFAHRDMFLLRSRFMDSDEFFKRLSDNTGLVFEFSKLVR